MGFFGWRYLGPLAEASRQAAEAVPDQERWRSMRDGMRKLLTALVGLSAAAFALAGVWAVPLGAAVVLAALWSPWAPLRILAALSLILAAAIGAIAALIIAAGGPDSRGGPFPALPVVAVAALAFLVPPLLLIVAEARLWHAA